MAAKVGSKIVYGGLMVLLVVGLGGFGATNFGANVGNVASVGDTDIDTTQYGNALQQELQALQAQTGQEFTIAQAEQFGVTGAVLDRLIDAAAVREAARRLGLSAGDEQVRQDVVNTAAFQGLDGTFDPEGYRAALSRAGIKTSAYEDEVREGIAANLIQGAVTSGVIMPQVFTTTVIDWLSETRTGEMVVLSAADLSAPIGSPDADALQAVYEADPAAYTLPETRKITYAWLTPDMLVDSVDLNEDALRKVYDDNISQYNQPERRLIERLVFGSGDEAQAAADRIASGEVTFEEVVSERGLALSDTDLGDVAQSDLGAAGDSVFAAANGDTLGPIDSNLGPALFRVNGILAATTTSFDEARPEIAADIALDTARRQILGDMDRVNDELAAGATLEELADDTDMELGQIDWTPASDTGIASYADFQSAARSAQVGDFPEVIQLSDGGMFALRLDEITPPALQPLDDVRAQVESAWETRETLNALSAQAKALADQVSETTDLASLAETASLTLRPLEALGRQGFVDAAPEGVVDALFDPALAVGTATTVAGEETVAVIALTQVRAPEDTPETQTLSDTLSDTLSQSLGQDLLDAFTTDLRDQYGVKINQAAVNAVHNAL
ncbi:Peptidyl-prolyl cis-trans isomerase D [Aquimixticola soesokkakensis]|uniref:Peptidyl-prolyl cis-trans isomerase D n=1 Tax=Aquimixticola soesokkakensis TaxID=1519096 RepID=A0A1Y5TJJ5_9RHOB|nr:SurA N-terminal domain-containing protein [Aquimixticola soesokkakensis]SLN65620.1 Peptidyl-prolyl cis-trans isomerase D [Aquimixticola soesokkakensis]